MAGDAWIDVVGIVSFFTEISVVCCGPLLEWEEEGVVMGVRRFFNITIVSY